MDVMIIDPLILILLIMNLMSEHSGYVLPEYGPPEYGPADYEPDE